MSHRIDRLKFDVRFSDSETARDLQDKIFSICRNGLNSKVDQVLEQFEISLSLEKLELDLGEMARSDLDQKLLSTLEEKLLEALESELEALHEHRSSEQYQLEALLLFLEQGLKHWSDVEDKSLLDLFRDVLQRSSRSLFRFLVSTRHQTTAVDRLVTLIDRDDYSALIRKMRPAEASFILGFIEDVREVNAKSPFSSATSGNQLDQQLRELVLRDLIKDYGSAFNRRMFIERNLQALAKAFNLTYSELLEHFERVLNESIPFSMNSTLPALIRGISEKYAKGEAHLESQSQDMEEVFQSMIALTGGVHQMLEENYEDVLEAYAGDLRDHLMLHTKTADQVKAMVNKLSETRLQQLITVVEPEEATFIQTYISGAKSMNPAELDHKSDQSLLVQVYEVVFGYLLIDRGTRFNQKTFLRYQLKGMSQATGVSYAAVLELLRMAMSLLGPSNLGSGVIGFLDEFLHEEETTIAHSSVAVTEQQVDELTLVKTYLKSGTVPVTLRQFQETPMLSSLERSLNDDQSRATLFEFLRQEKQKVLASLVDMKAEEFEVIVRILLMERWGFNQPQMDAFLEHLRKVEKQAVFPIGFRKVIFQTLLSSAVKATEVRPPVPGQVGGTAVSEMLFYQLREQLSLPQVIAHPDFQNTMDADRRGATSFDRARKRLLQALETTDEEPATYERAAIRESFEKIQESELETFVLLDHLRREEVQYLFASLEKQHLQKLVEQLTTGKWQVLKKSLQLIIKGGSTSKPEIGHFFAELVIRRNDNIDDVFTWINQEYTQLSLPNYYLRVLHTEQEKAGERLEVATTNYDEDTTLARELDLLIRQLIAADTDGSQQATTDAIFSKLIKKDAGSLQKRLRRIAFRLADVRTYIENLGDARIVQWIKLETGANHKDFEVQTQIVERLLLEVFKKDRSIAIYPATLLAIRLMLANKTGPYAVDFRQVLKFYLQEIAEHSSYKYQLLQKWLFNGIKRSEEQLVSWMPAKDFAVIENEIIVPQARKTPPSDEVVEKIMEQSEALSNLKVPNAGLVLIWPFFQRLFSMLDYLNEEGEFLSIVEKSRAVRLLHYISGFEWDEPEYNLTLNKILCGLPFSERMEPNLDITEKEITIAEEMLNGVIQNWNQLGSTSIEGFRNSFLMREGILEKEEENWTLKVDKQGIDILIDYMPWSYASVIMKWMPGVVYVDWRS